MVTASEKLALVAVAPTCGLLGCELREISLTEPEHVVVAEAYVQIKDRGEDGSGLGVPLVSVFLHETLGRSGSSGPVPGATIALARAGDGTTIRLGETQLGNCVITIPVDGGGTCYGTGFSLPAGLATLAPGDRLDLRIELPDGGVLTSQTVIPGPFDLLGVADGSQCTLAPFTSTGIVWSRSEGAWADISDSFVSGLRPRFGAEQVDDPLYLWGLSVSAQDTTIVFPREFGVFLRGWLDREVALTLQQGLPGQASAQITVAAVDRNWVNWARGGNFNPSGVVRVPSVRGDGTGVFEAAVLRSFRVLADSAASPAFPPCPPAPPSPAIR